MNSSPQPTSPSEPPALRSKISPDDAGARLDQWLAAQLDGVSRSQIQRHIRNGKVTVGGASSTPRHRVKHGEEIVVAPFERPDSGKLEPLDWEIPVLYEDEHLIVVNKPVGLVVHPAPGHANDTLANALLAHVGPEIELIGGERRCGIVHRLDRMTSGLMLVAKTELAHERLTHDLAERTIDRRYLGLALGTFKEAEGTIDKPIARRLGDRKRMGIVREGRPSRTSYKVLIEVHTTSLILIRLHSGRTHQIRVHLQSIGRPVIGDLDYGYTKKQTLSRYNSEIRSKLGPVFPKRQLLHAAGLCFAHPASGEQLRIVSPMPADMKAVIEVLLGTASTEQSAEVIFAPVGETKPLPELDPTQL